jgi:chromosomal replication initiation ATPase DnaA
VPLNSPCMNVWKAKVSAKRVWRHNANVTYARQFALPFANDPPYAAADFFPSACNAAAMAWLDDVAAWPLLRLAVYGPEGTGKTHLLHYFAARHHAALLPASAVRRFAPPPDAPALGIDDADSVADAEALLHLLNAAAERAIPVLLTGRTAPAHWNFKLPDLVSRLRATAAVALSDPDDDLLKALLARLLSDRQMAVPERMQNYLLARLPRTGHALREAAARLDRYSLAEGRAVTPKLAQRVIDEFEGET